MYEIFERLLAENGLRASDVAKGTGLSSTFFTEWKKGKSKNPNPKNLKKVADYFGVTLDYLMTGKDKDGLTDADNKDIAKDLENIKRKLMNKEDGPASFDGTDIPEEDIEMFAGQIEIMLRRLKTINKEKYNPNKNKK